MKKLFLPFLLIFGVIFLPSMITPELYSSKELRAQSGARSVQLTRGAIEYERQGDSTAPTILFLNGFSVPFSMWNSQVNYFRSHGFQTVRFNYYGRGLSDYPAGKYDRNEFVAATLELIDSLKLRSVNLVGHSYGGAMASEVSAARPAVVKSIVCIDPMLDKITGVSGAMLARLPLIGGWMTRLAVSRGVENRAKALFAEAGVPGPNPYLEDLQLQRKTKGYHRAMHAMFRSNALENYESSYARLGTLSIPTLILYGERETITPPEAMPTILNAMPSAQKLYFKHTCHLIHLQKPDSVNHVIETFLRESNGQN